MTWNDFKCLPENLKGKEEVFFSTYTDDAVVALKLAQAKSDLLTDLETTFSLNLPDDIAVIEEMLDNTRKLEKLREALSCKQLYWFFVDNAKGEGSLNDSKARFYKIEYESKKTLFAALKNKEIGATTVARVRRG